MMQIKLLEPERFHELPVEANPQSAIVVVAEDEETKEIKDYWIAQLQVHIEPVYIDPEHRHTSIPLKMFVTMLAALNSFGIKAFYAFADRPEIADQLDRIGLVLTPFVTYLGVVPEVPQCPSLSSLPESEPQEHSVAEPSPDQAQTT